MDRDLNTIREEIFSLDPSVQAQLADEIEENLASNQNMKLWAEEAKRRREDYLNGNMASVDPAETFAKTRKIIERARRTRG